MGDAKKQMILNQKKKRLMDDNEVDEDELWMNEQRRWRGRRRDVYELES